MNKRVGMESIFGLGGGSVSDSSRKYLEMAEDLCRKRKPTEALPYLQKALAEDPSNLDAYVQFAFVMPTTESGISLLEMVAEKGREQLKETLGPDCFDDDSDYVGHFWGVLETRPYMRVMQALVRLNVESKHYDKAAEVITEMLRLCPGDNLGQRSWMGSILLHAGRTKDTLHFSQGWLRPDAREHGTPPEKGGCAWDEPSSEPLPAEEVKKMTEWTPAGHCYDAALAAFKLWGDCELARQYYQLATRLNPNVMIKILARTDKPKSLNNSPRSQNGPEEAHDYLWLAQDLWMEDDVWNWANSQDKTSLLRVCSRRGCNNHEKDVAEFKRCAACHEVWYCGATCQKQDWKGHKPACQDGKRIKDAMKMLSQRR